MTGRKKITVDCEGCGNPFQANVADRNRGWGRFCSKSCKAAKINPNKGPVSVAISVDTGRWEDQMRECLIAILPHMIGRSLSDDDLWIEECQRGNAAAMVVMRARALINPKGRAAELLTPVLDAETDEAFRIRIMDHPDVDHRDPHIMTAIGRALDQIGGLHGLYRYDPSGKNRPNEFLPLDGRSPNVRKRE